MEVFLIDPKSEIQLSMKRLLFFSWLDEIDLSIIFLIGITCMVSMWWWSKIEIKI
jgi:hypothetical protein